MVWALEPKKKGKKKSPLWKTNSLQDATVEEGKEDQEVVRSDMLSCGVTELSGKKRTDKGVSRQMG